MGQRLNLQIEDYGVAIANAYYHWSAYTESAARLVVEALDVICDAPPMKTDSDKIETAIRALTETGAGFNEREISDIKTEKPEFFVIASATPCSDRNNGLISITDDGISETEKWAEGAAIIDIGEWVVRFGVMSSVDEDVLQEDSLEGESSKECRNRIFSQAKHFDNIEFTEMSFHDMQYFYEILQQEQFAYFSDCHGELYQIIE